MESKHRPNWEIVMRAMNLGMEIKMPDGYTYTMVDGKLCLRLEYWEDASKLSEPSDEIRWVESAMSLNDFIKYCEGFDEQKIAGFVVFNAINRNKKRD